MAIEGKAKRYKKVIFLRRYPILYIYVPFLQHLSMKMTLEQLLSLATKRGALACN
jgi:hypothetical protein